MLNLNGAKSQNIGAQSGDTLRIVVENAGRGAGGALTYDQPDRKVI
jgi:hypothetical protein